MAITIRWSAQASDDLERIITYLENTWGEKSIKEFVQTLDQKIQAIAQMPEMYPASGIKKGVRRCVITAHNTLYYRIVNGEIEIEAIEIITIFDVRQSPDKIKI